MVKIFVTRKNSLTSLLWMVIEKICEAKIFGMKAAFKWNNKCVQVKNTTVRKNNIYTNFQRIDKKVLGKLTSKKKYQTVYQTELSSIF